MATAPEDLPSGAGKVASEFPKVREGCALSARRVSMQTVCGPPGGVQKLQTAIREDPHDHASGTSCKFNNTTVFPPFREPSLEAPRVEAVLAEGGDRLVGVDAIGPPTVRDDLGVGSERGTDPVQLAKRHVQGARNVPGSVFVRGPDIEHDDRPVGEPRRQFLAPDRLGAVLAAREPAQDAFNLRQVPLGHKPQQVHQHRRLWVGQAVDHRLAGAAAGDKCSAAQLLQML